MSLDNVAKRAMREESAKYNGWTNYATWRVNLEMIDGMQIEDITYANRHYDLDNAYELGQAIKEWCESLIEDTSSEGLARDYALAFLSDVNWVEIAEHLIEAYEEA